MKKIIITIVIIIIAAGAWYFIWGQNSSRSDSPNVVKNEATPQSVAEISSYKYDQTYSDSTYKFSFKYPSSFVVTPVSDQNGGETVLVQDIAKKIGAQIVISKFDGPDIDITADYIKEGIPDMKISEPQVVEIGVNRKGLAFESDNEAFGGKSREVWFVYKGNLYQISTYAELDAFLKGLFATWEFK